MQIQFTLRLGKRSKIAPYTGTAAVSSFDTEKLYILTDTGTKICFDTESAKKLKQLLNTTTLLN